MSTNQYDSELAGLQDTYAAGLRADITRLKTAIAGASEASVIAVGSGGSFTVASLLCSLHETYTGRVSRPSTPLEIICNPTLAAASPAFFISAEGKNPDIIEALQRARLYSARPIQVLTNREASPLTESATSLTDITLHLFPLVRKDGFLATNSLLLDAVLIARAYGELSGKAPPLPSAMNELRISGVSITACAGKLSPLAQEAVKRRGLLVVYSPHLRAVAADLESKLSEAALLYCQTTDLRSFAHGRHLWLTERSQDCVLLALIDASLMPLWNRTREYLPKDIPVAVMELADPNPLGLLAGLIGEMHFISEVAKTSGRDAGKADVGQAGRDLHYLQYADLIAPPDLSGGSERESKYDVLGAAWPNQRSFGKLERAYGEYKAAVERQTFRGLVFDYDGTLCRSHPDDLPPPDSIVQHMRKLVDAGVAVGVASGRGDSVQQQLKALLPSDYWPKIFLGLYNGGWLAQLNSDIPASTARKNSELLSHVTRIVGRLRELGTPIETIRPTHPYQVSIRFRDGVHAGHMWFVIADALNQAGLKDITVVHSNHSVDVLETGVDKSHLVARMVQEFRIDPYQILTLGDQGAWPGNDASLLEHRYSLSVNVPSRRIDRGWKAAPVHKRDVDATLWYLERVKLIGSGAFQINLST
jgi:HAD superfamily hydrolase (TIGR01484 family)